MAEILASVADAVKGLGVDVLVAGGEIDDYYDSETVFVVVPHEYFVLTSPPSKGALRRTIAFGVEHPGTETFETSVTMSARTAARVEIAKESVGALRARGLKGEHFLLGYSARWDRWGGASSALRPVDLAYLGTSDPDRLRVLARIAPDIAGMETEILTPPHEQMTKPRPDFLMGEAKWDLLSRTKVLLNLHREQKTTLEWVRVLEGMCNGCVVLSEPSTDIAPLVPGEHILISSRARIGAAVRAAVGDSGLRNRIAAEAYRFCREELDMRPSAQRLAAIAGALLRTASGARSQSRGTRRPPIADGQARATWLPVPVPLPSTQGENVDYRSTAQPLTQRDREQGDHEVLVRAGSARSAQVDVVCVAHRAAGPLALTVASLQRSRHVVCLNLHVGGIGWARAARLRGIDTFTSFDAWATVGYARNYLLGQSGAPYILVVDAGDEVLADGLQRMVAELDGEPSADICYTYAANGTEGLVNAFVPEPWRIERHGYLGRGYLFRRQLIDSIGLFSDDPAVQLYVDHGFWLRVADAGIQASHLRRIGFRLWANGTSRLADVDPP